MCLHEWYILQGSQASGDYMEVEKQVPNYSLDNMSSGFQGDILSNTNVSVTADEDVQKKEMSGTHVLSNDKTRVTKLWIVQHR